jgi:hypothetical protein
LEDELRCKLEGVEIFEKKSERFGDSIKFRAYVRADQGYILESSLLTESKSHYYNNWTGSFLMLLDAMTDEQLQSEIWFYQGLGTETNAIFARAYVGGQRIEASSPEPKRGEHQAIIDRVNAVLGWVPRGQSKAQPATQAHAAPRQVAPPPEPPAVVTENISREQATAIHKELKGAGIDSTVWMVEQGYSRLGEVKAQDYAAVLAAAQASAKAAQDPAVLAAKALAGAMSGEVMADA